LSTRKSMKNTLLKGYIGFGVAYLLIILLGREDFAWFLKPFLLPFLLAAVYRSENFVTKKILLTALTFSWIGDIILMFADKGELYFIFGLVAFLISHIFYIILFLKQESEGNALKSLLFLLCCLVVLFYLKSMLSLLFPTLGDLKIPVSVYAVTISTMLIVALKGYFGWKNAARYFILIGAVSFVTSDSLLAIDKFHSPLANNSFWIMITYLIAQGCITYGILKLNQKNSVSKNAI
jgi:uncharacterized membrane protein YhhN